MRWIDFYEVFRGSTLANGEKIVVEQTEWKDLHVQASATGGTVCFLKKSENPWPFSTQKEERIVKPDFVLVRNFPKDIHENDFRNMVIGLIYGGLDGVNSPTSILMCMDRPLIYAELLKLSKTPALRSTSLTLIPMNYWPNQPISTSAPTALDPSHATTFPLVCKVSSTHAGFGKMRASNEADLKDLRCILALHKDYFTTEPIIDFDYEFRIQKIGDHYRAFKRGSDTSWKGNWGNLRYEDMEFHPDYKIWADECSKMFGGLEILALDVLHTTDGHNIVIELNDTAFGLMWEHSDEDNKYIRDVAIDKMNRIFAEPNQ
eukprot:TRINITY_DN3002_c0_g1_i3.p1 TRINITY_DN3002_c0_g1~~TRINITY_DN3002_c0_g1_i3.p1  ORF type:complete len:318 (+),score=71.59 TRINITY_DN3002_c0_g1_i3:235-1188(+)